MKGSEKQIKWAEAIKNKMQPNFEDLQSKVNGNAPANKAINYINNLDNATFWIDNRSNTPTDMLRKLCGHGLKIRGNGYSHVAKIDQVTGKITITWDEIISDGKGGYKETKIKEV